MRRDITVSRWGARFLGRSFPCSVGRGGIVAAERKREGDGATPDGAHAITGILYRADRLPRPADWAQPIGSSDLWSDDPKDFDYNQMVRAPHRFSHERLARPDPMYDLILLTGWNADDPVPGMGSAIFLHAWRRPRWPTAGCVAFAAADLRWIAERLLPDSRVVVRG